jgi:5-methylcytosine-specific restriction enzyme subunit McrC
MKALQDESGQAWQTESGIPIRNLWHMLLYAWDEPMLESPISSGDIEHSPTLDVLLAGVLIKAILQRMRLGLGRAYVNGTDRLRAVRGRVNFSESLRHHFFENGEAACDFQQFSADEPRNQVIRSTLVRLVQAGEFGPDRGQAEALRQRLRWLARNLNGIQLIELAPGAIGRLRAEQNDHDYRLMLSICEMFLLRQMPLETDGTHPLPHIDRDALLLHRIYERFVANFYRMHLNDWQVTAQKRLDWHAQEASDRLPSMVPDLVLQNKTSGQIVILDTKFTAESLVENRWGKPVYDSTHLYQLYAYLRSQEHLSNEHRAATGILLYPAARYQFSESVRMQDHTLRMECVDLAAPWQEMERQLLEIVKGS